MTRQTHHLFPPPTAAFEPTHELLGELARGDFARVYKARSRATGDLLAIKVLTFQRGDSDELVAQQTERFERELSLCERLSHPHIVRLRGSGHTPEGTCFAVFDYVPGHTLADILVTEGSLQPLAAIDIMEQVLDALKAAHGAGVIHRDLKPENIMITDSRGERAAMVLDFGLGVLLEEATRPERARLTQRGEFLGTPAYAAPEQIHGSTPTSLSDLYAWGLILIECLTGRQVMDGGSLPEIFHKQLGPDPVPVPAALHDHPLGALLAWVTNKDAALRASRAGDVQIRLAEVRGLPLPARETFDRPLWGEEPEPPSAPARSERLWRVPLRRNPRFIGRTRLLDQLEDLLGAGDDHAIVALQGLGGVGKTQLALEYTYRHSAGYHAVVWLAAGDPSQLADEFANLAEAFGLPERGVQDQRVRHDAVKRWFETHHGWLLVLDSAPRPEAIRSYLPHSDGGHVIVTTRNQGWRGLAGSIEVDVLEPEEAVTFLTERTGDHDRDAASTLADELGRLPLALEEAAAYMESTGRRSVSYLALFRERQRELLDASEPNPDYPTNLRSTWDISFRELEAEEPRAAAFLDRCAFLAPEGVPLALLRIGADPALEDDLVFDRCVATLRRYSLAKRENEALSVHRMVQLVARDRMSASDRRRVAEEVLRGVEQVFPASGLGGDIRPESGRLLPHALAALSFGATLPGCSAVAAQLLERTGTYLSARGLNTLASDHLSRAQKLIEDDPTPDPEALSKVLASHALVLYAIGEGESAERRLEQALSLQRTGGEDDVRAASAYINLAWVRRSLGNWEQARDDAERGLELVLGRYGEGHPMEAMALSILARVLYGLGAVGEARARATRSLAVLEARAGRAHPFACGAFSNLAHVLCELGEFEPAARCVELSLEIGERAYGPEHSLVSIGLGIRGALRLAIGEQDAARRDFERALHAGERTCMALHEDIATCRVGLAELLRQEGDAEAARQMAERALAGIGQVAGDSSRLEAGAVAELGRLDLEQGELAVARANAERACRILSDRHGPTHPCLAPPRFLLAATLLRLGNLEAAESESQSALADLERADLKTHPYSGWGFQLLAEVALARRQPELAGRYLERAAGLPESALGHRVPRTPALQERLRQME